MADYIVLNWYWILPIVVALAGAIVKVTPTKTDDAWWEKIKEVYRAVFDKKDKQ